MRNILVVDDSSVNRALINKMLSDEYHIIEAASGEEALHILDCAYGTISAVLLDIGLPGIDGYTVLANIRTNKYYSQMPVIMITASDDQENRLKSLKLGANDFARKPYSQEILKHCLQNNIVLSEDISKTKRNARQNRAERATPAFNFRAVILCSCITAFILSLCVLHFDTQSELRETCEHVTVDFTRIMDGYQHSFKMFELLLQQEIQNADSADEIESFLKSNDTRLLNIEGEDYDGVYMYYQGRYMYSWDTPYSAYAETGYDATTRPWYIGAVEANGEIFFSTPYPSYANNYMLATISRLQEDGETVIAYDIKLGEINKFVDRLNLYDGSLALICDRNGNIIGSTNHLYLGGNINATPEQLSDAVSIARETGGSADVKNEAAIASAQAQQQFIEKAQNHLSGMLEHPGSLRYSFSSFSFGYAYVNGLYTCFVIAPITTSFSRMAMLWATISFALIALAYLIDRMLRRNHQILSDVLTGLNNRRAFIKYCDNHILHHADENLGLLMLDLNHFKNINDVYGHATGDQALRDASAVLKSACQASKDNFFLCRYGGDEYLLATRAPDTAALERMRKLIDDGFKLKNLTSMTPYVLEASMGASCGICQDRKSVESLMKQADQAMYCEKRQLDHRRKG